MTKAQPTPASRPVTLYIGGFGRSGSTLLEVLLAEIPGVTALGEVTHLWERGIVLNQLCACGSPFLVCPFWSAVGDRAFGGWGNVDIPRVRYLKEAVDRQRRLPLTLRRRPSRAIHALASEYASLHRRIYDAAAAIARTPIVIDSSKEAPTAAALSHDCGIDLRVIHIVRDSRGVAYSWSKSVARPETRDDETMPRFSARQSSQWWLSNNVAIGALGHRGIRVHRIRYEDMLGGVQTTISECWNALDLPGSGGLEMLDPHRVVLRPTHSVAGNPMRFRTGETILRTDDEWRTALPVKQRRIVTILSYPLLRRYGYL